MDLDFENEFRSFKQQGEHTKMENRLAINTDQTFTNYSQQIASCLKGEIDFKKMTNVSFSDKEVGMGEVLATQQLLLQHHPKINPRYNCEVTTTYAIDPKGDVIIQVPPSAPKWMAARLRGDDEQFRRRAREMRRIQKKLEARGIATRPIT